MRLSQIGISAHVPIVVTDPRSPDNPIVRCNDAFLTLTGYGRDEVIGRNCRFLQGPDTERDRAAELGAAVAERRPVVVELTNYRKDGSSFCNSVMIAPIFGDDGQLCWFLGSQTEIRPQAGLDGHDQLRLAQEQIARLSARQKQVLALLSRGMRYKQIAFELSLSERTLKMHRANALAILGATTNAEAIRIAVKAGL